MVAASLRRRDGDPPFILGHRGVRGEAPENTMAAFELAAQSGANGVELDVRLCRSGEVVVCHDPALTRATEGRDTRLVADVALRELLEVDVGGGERVPVLEEVLAWARGQNMCVNVEIKRDVPERLKTVRETARVLRRAEGSVVIVSSFDPGMLAYFGWLLPAVPRGSLFGSDQRLLKLHTSGWVAALVRAVAVHPEKNLVSRDRCRTWKKHGKLVNVWTVNDPTEARSLADMGVDAIVTDVPRVLVHALR
jgi:glycerophosphoryl diester phosphodiesterase